jgi:hypothetical protein
VVNELPIFVLISNDRGKTRAHHKSHDPSISGPAAADLQQAAVKNAPAHLRNKLRPVLTNWVAGLCCVEFRPMSDQDLAVQAVRDAQLILEEYLEPRPHDHEGLLDRLVEVLERPPVMVAVDRLQRGVGQ